MEAPKPRIAREIIADQRSAARLLNAIRKGNNSIQFKGRTIRIRKNSEVLKKVLSSDSLPDDR